MDRQRSPFCLATAQTNLPNEKFSVFGHICSSGTIRSWTSSHFRSATIPTSNIVHVFCRRCYHSSKTFLPHLVLYCIAFGGASESRLVSSSLLFKFWEWNRSAIFLLQKLCENELLWFNAMIQYFQTPMGQLHAQVANMTNAIYYHGFIP